MVKRREFGRWPDRRQRVLAQQPSGQSYRSAIPAISNLDYKFISVQWASWVPVRDLFARPNIQLRADS